MDTLRQDLRFAVRQLRGQPGFTAIAVLTLGLGIGSATVIFNVAEVALYRPLPFEHEDRLVRVYRVPQAGTPWISLRPATYRAVERRGGFFDRIVAQRYTSFVHTTDAGPEHLVGIAVTAGWAETLGVRPHLGRAFTRDEERLGAAAGVALISHGAWQRRFGGEDDVLGREIVLNGRRHTIVGVMQPGLRYPYNSELWVPMRVEDEEVGPWAFNVVARLRPGMSLQDARTDLAGVARDAVQAGEAPTLADDGMTLTAFPLRELFVGDEGRTSVVLLGAVAFLLLIVSANLANLLLARGLSREAELAVRASIGASRGRLLRQLLTESLLLGAVGSALGILLARQGGALAQPLLPERLGFVEAAVTMNGTVLAFAVGLGLLITVLFGLLPALRLSRVRPGGGPQRARGATGDISGRRLGRSLVVGEIALGIVLLAGTGLIAQDLRRLASLDLGYEPAGLLTLSMALNREPYTTPAARIGFTERADSRLSSLPGISAVGATSIFPSERGNALARIEVQGQDQAPGTRHLVNHRLVTPGFFEAVGLPLIAGRLLSGHDRADAPAVAVISVAMARRFFAGANPIGQRVRRSGEDAEWMTVVGVVGDVREFYDVAETWYLPYAQHADERSASSTTFVVRDVSGRPASASLVRDALAEVAPDLPVTELITARELHAESLAHQRRAAGLSGAFAGFGLLLAAMGLYGSISYAVNRRRREFGIRVALGSHPGRILRDVLGEGARLVAIGTVIGAAGALVVTRLLARSLDTVAGFDPLSFAAAVLVLAATTLGAVTVPARRAARVDPAAVLREQ